MKRIFAKFLETKLLDPQSRNIKLNSFSEINENASIFDENGINIDGINFNELNSSDINSIINELQILQDITEVTTEGNSEKNKTDIEKFVKDLASRDGNNSNLSLEDINNMIDDIGNVVDSLGDVSKEELEETINKTYEDLTKEILPTKSPEEQIESNIQTTNEIPQTSNVVNDIHQATTQNSTIPTSKAPINTKDEHTLVDTSNHRDPTEIQKEIDAKNLQLDEIDTNANKEIQVQETAQKEAMKALGISETKIKEFEEQKLSIEENIKQQDVEIKNTDDEIRDTQTTISSNENYINDISAQIQEQENLKNSIPLDEKRHDSRSSYIDEMIAQLTTEKNRILEENTQLEEQEKELEKNKEELESKKAGFEQEKQNLIQTTLNSPDLKLTEKEKESILAFDTYINEIETNKETEKNTVQNEIKTLEVELKNSENAQDRTTFLNEHYTLGITREDLAYLGTSVGGQNGTSGFCLAGVNTTLEYAYGFKFDYASACMSLEEMQRTKGFVDVSNDWEESEIPNLPAGYIVIWEADEVNKHGHIAISLGEGREACDNVKGSQYGERTGEQKRVHVFKPVLPDDNVQQDNNFFLSADDKERETENI